jgi:hypothetical protein
VRNISPATESTYGRRPAPGSYRWAWAFPLAVGRKAPYPLYVGSQYLLRSLDGGASWEKASPDLSGAQENAQNCPTTGSPSPEDAKRCGYGVIWSIEISPRDDAEIWIGTDDGVVRLTRDAGKTWKDVTPRGLPAWSKIASVDASPLEPGVAYVAVDRHRADDFTPHLYRTRDYGATWQEISNGLPASRFTTVVRADTVRRGLLYAGTDGGVSVSFDDGGHWQPLQSGLPTALGRRPPGARRGPRRGDAGTRLLGARRRDAPAPAVGRRGLRRGDADRARFGGSRSREHERRHAAAARGPAAPNPPGGAIVDYVLGRAAKSVKLEILDAKGGVVRAYSSDAPEPAPKARQYFTDRYIRPQGPPPTTAGHHRWVWDLRYPRPAAEQYEYMISAVAGQDAPVAPRGPLALPGRYTVRLTVDGATQEQPLELTMDPRSKVDAAVLADTLALQRDVSAAMGASYDALVEVRAVRKSIAASKEKAGSRGLADADAKAKTIESGDAQAGGGRRRGGGGGLAGANARLAGILNALDGADAPPTAAQREAAGRLRQEIDALVAEWRALKPTLPKDLAQTRPDAFASDPSSRSGIEIE